MRLDPGTMFAGYAIERILGVGGMGAVYLARHPRLERLVALKVLDGVPGDDALARTRFEREAALVARLDQPNIVPVYDCGIADSGAMWISMKYIDGGDTAHLIAGAGGRVPAARAVQLIADAAHGLDYAHRHGILHRDVKPANILIERGDHGAERAVLTDFGIARAFDDAQTMTGTTATFAYVAPERFTGESVDNRADVYSLGCTLYELLTGRTPFPRPNQAAVITAHLNDIPPRPTAIQPGLPAGLDAVIAIAMAKRPADRYPTCTALAEAGQRVISDARQPTVFNPHGVPPMSMPPQRIGYSGPYGFPQQPGPPIGGGAAIPHRPKMRSRTVGLLVAIAVLVAAAITVGAVLTRQPDKAPTAAPPITTTTTTTTTTTKPVVVGIQLLDDGVRIGIPDAPKVINMFNEPICPPCGKLLTSSAPDIRRAIDTGRLAVQFHLLNFLDSSSVSGNYSTRAVAASRCVAESGDAHVYLNVYAGLFAPAFQPQEKASTDRTDAELAQLARNAAAASSAIDCIRTGRLADLARATASQGYRLLDELMSNGVSTPAVFNGLVQVNTARSDWVSGLN